MMEVHLPLKVSLRVAVALIAALSFGKAEACLTHPLKGAGRITSVPSMRFHPKLHIMRWHKGLDIGIGSGTPIYAAQAGTVRAAFQSPGAGIYVSITGGGYQTKYFHMSKRVATQGQQVAAGELIGYVGMTGGISTGPHLHFEVWRGGDFMRNIPPMLCSGGNYSSPPPQGDEDAHEEGQGLADQTADTMGPLPTGPNMDSWDDISTRQLVSEEVTRRFMNQQWLEQLAEQGRTPLLIELNYQMAFRQYLRERIRRQEERIELLRAAKFTRTNRREMEIRLRRQREAAAKAAGAAQP